MRMKKKIVLCFVYCCLMLAAFISLPTEAFGQKKTQAKQTAKLVAEGDAVFQQKDYHAAVDKYAQAITLTPNLPKAHFWKGNAHLQLNEYDQAVLELDAAQVQGYKPLDVYKARWLAHYGLKNYDLALQDAEKALQLDPKNSDFTLAVGEIQLAKNLFQDALDTFQKYIVVNPNNADAYYYIASAYAGLGNVEPQKAAANEAIKKNTKYLGEAYFLIAEASRKDKNNAQSIEFYQKTISAKPGIYAAYHNLSDVYRRQNRLNEAIEVTKRGLLAFPDDGNFYVDLGRYYSLAARNFEAIPSAQQAVKLLPEQFSGYTILCRAYYETKQYQPALNSCNSSLKINPADGETNVYLGFTYLSLNKEDVAKDYFRKAVNGMLEFTKANPDYFDGFYLLGNAYYYVEQPQKAIEAYLKTLELNPDFTKARFNLGLAYFVGGNLPAAREQYNILLKTNKDLAQKLKMTIDKK